MRKLILFFSGYLLACISGSALGQPSTSGSTPNAGETKICAPFVDDGWRTVVAVPGTWSLADCGSLVTSMEANRWRLGCLFEASPKFSWGQVQFVGAPPRPAVLPSPNCGW